MNKHGDDMDTKKKWKKTKSHARDRNEINLSCEKWKTVAAAADAAAGADRPDDGRRPF